MKPMPSAPMRWRTGTRTSSKKICAVSEHHMPNFLIFCTATPLARWPLSLSGTMINDLFLCIGPSEVLHSRQIQSAWVPLVIHIWAPEIRWSPPSRRAWVCSEATSEPAPCSDTPMQATTSPAMAGARNSRLSSSEPKAASDADALGAHIAHRLAGSNRVGEIQAQAAVLGGLGDAQKAEAAHLLEQF